MTKARRELTRRQWLGSVGVASVGTALATTSSAAEDDIRKMTIDAHSHIWTRDIKKYPLKKGTTLKDLAPPSFTTEELLKVMSQHDVGRAVLIAHHTFYGYDNTYMTDAARQHPERFRVVGMVDDAGSDPAARMRKLLTQKVTAFRITSWINKAKWLSTDGMAAMWKCAAETQQAMCCLTDPDYLPSVDAMCRKHPQTPVVIDHFARIGVDGQIRKGDVDNLCKLARHKKTHVKISAYYALGKKKPPYQDLVPMIRRLLDAYGPERLMWASDSPYQIDGANTYQASVDLVRKGLPFTSKSDREWLLRKTAQKVFFYQ